MKRLSIIICTLYLMLLPFGLTACGTTEAKGKGIMAGGGEGGKKRSVKVIFWA